MKTNKTPRGYRQDSPRRRRKRGRAVVALLAAAVVACTSAALTLPATTMTGDGMENNLGTGTTTALAVDPNAASSETAADSSTPESVAPAVEESAPQSAPETAEESEPTESETASEPAAQTEETANTSNSSEPESSEVTSSENTGVSPAVLNVNALLASATAKAPNVQLKDEPVDLGEPAHQKYIKDNNDGTYTLSLNVTGSSRQTKEHPPIDVVLVVDESTSMNQSSGNGSSGSWWDTSDTKMQVVKKAATQLAQKLLTSSNANLPEDQQIQMSVVLFGNDASGGQSWTANSWQIANAIPSEAPYNNGTNWEAGLELANESNSGRQNAQKYIIFLSDGEPTYRESNWIDPSKYYVIKNGNLIEVHWEGEIIFGHWEDSAGNQYDIDSVVSGDRFGTGNSDPFKLNYTSAVDEANKRGNVQLYVVSAGGDSDDVKVMEEFAQATNGVYHDGTDPDSLLNAFEEIGQAITKNYTYDNVVIQDTLSQWAEFVESDPTFTYTKTDQDGNTEEWVPPQANATNNTITWNLGRLDAGATYTISFEIKPTAKAYKDYAVNVDNETYPNNQHYPDIGDENTDAPNNNTSSKKPGYFSNQTATVTYETLGEGDSSGAKGSAIYNNPVIQVNTSTLTINKVWKDENGTPITDTSLMPAVTVNVTQENSESKQVTLNSENNWTYKLTVPANGSHTYSIEEVSVEGFTTSYTDSETASDDASEQSLTLAAGGSGSFTITNTAEKTTIDTVTIQKVSSGNPATPLANAEFKLYREPQNGEEGESVAGKYNLVEIANSTGTTYADGKITYAGLLEANTNYYLVETKAPDGYTILTDPVQFTIEKDETSGAYKIVVDENSAGVAKTSDDDSLTLVVTNTPGHELPSTGSIGTTPFATIGGPLFAVCAVGLGFGLRRRRGKEAK